MTDVRNAGTPREVLFAPTAAATVAGIVREVLLITPTALTVTGMVREVLLLSPPAILGGQAAVTINTG